MVVQFNLSGPNDYANSHTRLLFSGSLVCLSIFLLSFIISWLNKQGRIKVQLGKVYGPYEAKDRAPYVVIQLLNPDGSQLGKRMISYNSYLKQKSQGLHEYKDPNPEDLKISRVRSPLNKTTEDHKHSCTNCSKPFLLKYLPTPGKRIFCSEQCRSKYRIKQAKKEPLTFDNQFVVTINRNKPNQHYIIVENIPGNRVARFLPTKLATLELFADKDNKSKYRLKYNIKDTVLIRPVKGFKHNYWITESGVLVNRKTRNIINVCTNKKGYKTYAFRIGNRTGKAVCFRIHRLVGEAFIPNTENKPQINHIDGIKTNNHVSNLEWCTNQENTQHAYRTGLNWGRVGTESPSSKFTYQQIKDIRLTHKQGKEGARSMGRKYKVSHSTILDIVKHHSYTNIT